MSLPLWGALLLAFGVVIYVLLLAFSRLDAMEHSARVSEQEKREALGYGLRLDATQATAGGPMPPDPLTELLQEIRDELRVQARVRVHDWQENGEL